ncbi:hypothetical protein ABRY95_04755 [Castellaniella ginsengisoli]|uniref:TspB protein n=1 Tax=Castellaniella ginsengisoli TaxID=546114 RepID=A0AB39G8R7_9BURK
MPKIAISIAVFLLFLFSCSLAFADEVLLPARENKVWLAGGKALENNSYVRSFSRVDPRVIRTFEGISSQANIVVAQAPVISSAAARPAIATALRTIGRVSTIGFPVALAVGGVIEWYFDSEDDDSVVVNRRETSGELIVGKEFWYCKTLKAPEPEKLVSECFARNTSYDALKPSYDLRVSEDCSYPSSGGYRCAVERRSKAYPSGGWTVTGQEFVYFEPDGSKLERSCPPGYFLDGSVCIPYSAEGGGSSEPVRIPIADAIAALPEEDKSSKLNPQWISDLMNQLWQQAASQPGYQGLPYSPSHAVSPQDFSTVSPDDMPTVDDFVKPVERPSTESPINVDPSTNTGSGSSGGGGGITNPGTGDQINLGGDPNIGAPSLETPPTAQMIIQPLTTLFPELRSYQANIPSGECPRPAVDVFDHSYVLDAHCDLFEQNRSVLQASMLAAFGILSLVIVLKA